MIPGSGAPVGCGTGEPCLPLEAGPWIPAAEPLSATPPAVEAPPPDPPVAAPEPALSELLGLEPPELLETSGLEAFEPETSEPELSEDPPPQPASASAATASARAILTLAAFARFTRRR